MPVAGQTHYVDITVVDPLSDNASLLQQRSRKDGAAAEDAADDKLRKYPGASTVPFTVESYGRIGKSAKTWLQVAYHDQPQLKQSLLNELNVMMQSHTSSMILAAYGAGAVGRRRGEMRQTAVRGV